MCSKLFKNEKQEVWKVFVRSIWEDRFEIFGRFIHAHILLSYLVSYIWGGSLKGGDCRPHHQRRIKSPLGSLCHTYFTHYPILTWYIILTYYTTLIILIDVGRRYWRPKTPGCSITMSLLWVEKKNAYNNYEFTMSF